jgi:hypothetical protein
MTDTPQTQPRVARNRSWLGSHWALLFLLLIPLWDIVAVLIAQWLPSLQAWVFSRDCEQAISWVRTSYPAPGVYRQLALPPQLHRLSARGTVDAVVLPDGRIVLLLKETVDEHEWRRGIIWSSSPPKSSEIDRTPHGRDRIRINGLQDVYVTVKIDDRHYHVLLDPD